MKFNFIFIRSLCIQIFVCIVLDYILFSKEKPFIPILDDSINKYSLQMNVDQFNNKMMYIIMYILFTSYYFVNAASKKKELIFSETIELNYVSEDNFYEKLEPIPSRDRFDIPHDVIFEKIDNY